MNNTRALKDIAKVIRSKNAGPFLITLDIIFADSDTYERVKASHVLNKEYVARLYGVSADHFVSYHEFDAGNAIKITFRRDTRQGSIGETDVYGAQQHAPLLDIRIPWS